MIVAIGDIAKVFNGKTPAKSEQRDTGYPVLKIRDVDALGNIRGDFESFVDFELAEKFRTKHLCEGDTLILNAAHNSDYVASKTFYATCNHLGPLITGEWTVVRPDSALADPRYVRHYIESPTAKRLIKEMVNGIHLYPKDVARCPIPLPPLPEQRRIAAILDKADALRTKRREAIAKLDQLLQSVFLEMFGDPVTNPKGWPVVSIKEACESIVDCVNRTAPTVDYITSYKMIRTTNVRNFKVSLDSVRYVDKAVFDDWNRRLLPQKGDVILTREAPAGEAGILDSDDQVFLGQRLMLYRVNQQLTMPEYLLYSFMGEGMQQQFKKQSSGSTVKHLSVPDCRSWELMLPPIDLQKKFTERAAMNWSLRQQVLEHSAKLEDLFLSIQKSAFSVGL